MNPGQQQVYLFLMEQVRDDKKAEARALLDDSFAKQAAGTLNRAYLDKIVPKFLSIAKPGAIDVIKAAMSQYASRL